MTYSTNSRATIIDVAPPFIRSGNMPVTESSSRYGLMTCQLVALDDKAAFFGPTVANGALRTWLDLQLAPPSRD